MAQMNKAHGGMAQATTIDESRLGVSYGVDEQLPFSTPFSPLQYGINQPRKSTGQTYELPQYSFREGEPTITQLEVMRSRDGQAQRLHSVLTLPIRSALKGAKILPTDKGEKEAQFIRDVLYTSPLNGGMVVPFNMVMAQVLEALFVGFAAFEKVFWVPTKGPLKGKKTLKKLAHRPSSTVTFITDDHGGFAGFRQRVWAGPEQRDVYIEPKYAFYYAAREELRKFYGVSFFNSAFYHYDKKDKLYYTAHLAAQRSAVGTRIGTVPPGASASDKRLFSQALANMALAQYLAVPEGFEVDVLREGGNFDFLTLIDHHDSQMAKSVLASFLDGGSSGTASGSAPLVSFAEPGDDMFLLMLRAIMEDIATAINFHVIPQLIDLNFSSGKYPVFTWGELTDQQQAAVGDMFKQLAAAGQSLTVTPEFMRALETTMSEVMGLDIDYDKIDAREQEEQAAAEAQFALEQGLGPDGAPLEPVVEPVDPALITEGLAAIESRAAAPVEEI